MKTEKKLTSEELFQKFGKKKEHALQVQNYSEKLFNIIDGSLENFPAKAKEYLKIAAYLHDIGYSVEKKSHHKHTMTLILENGIDGFSDVETRIIANIARYHRASFPSVDRHEEYAKLSEEDRMLVQKLSAILRMADGLDKPEKNLILRIEMQNLPDSIVFTVKTVGFKPKLIAAKEKSDLFE